VSALILAIDAVHAAINDERRNLGAGGIESGRAVDHARTARLLSLHAPAAE
jgi:hypothetical protein